MFALLSLHMDMESRHYEHLDNVTFSMYEGAGEKG